MTSPGTTSTELKLAVFVARYGRRHDIERLPMTWAPTLTVRMGAALNAIFKTPIQETGPFD